MYTYIVTICEFVVIFMYLTRNCTVYVNKIYVLFYVLSKRACLFIIYCKPVNGELAINEDQGELDCGGSVVECWTQGQGVGGSSLTRGCALCPWARHFILTHPDMTEKNLTGM